MFFWGVGGGTKRLAHGMVVWNNISSFAFVCSFEITI